MFWPQPTAQYGHTLFTSVAPLIRAVLLTELMLKGWFDVARSGSRAWDFGLILMEVSLYLGGGILESQRPLPNSARMRFILPLSPNARPAAAQAGFRDTTRPLVSHLVLSRRCCSARS